MVTEAPAPEPEPEPEPAPEAGNPYGFIGYDAQLYDYALSQGCNDTQACCYVALCNRWGESNVLIGSPGEGAYWSVWAWNGTEWIR